MHARRSSPPPPSIGGITEFVEAEEEPMEALRPSGPSRTLRPRCFSFLASWVSLSSYCLTPRVHRPSGRRVPQCVNRARALLGHLTLDKVRPHPSAASAAAGTRPSCLLPRTFIRRLLGFGTHTDRAYTSRAIDRTSPWNAHPTSASASTTGRLFYAACQANGYPLPDRTLLTSTRWHSTE